MSDLFDRAKNGFESTKAFYSEQHNRMKEDLVFSNPTNPQQWDSTAVSSRLQDARPCLTFDYTNQYIMQVVNDQRMNKPGIEVLPVGNGADIQVATTLEGLFRHIEYVSRAGIAYDTSIEHAARVGLGWMRVVPEIVDPETNQQEIRIKRIVDPLSAMLDKDSTEPDGSDAMCGWIESRMSKDAFMRLYPKSKTYKADSAGWYSDEDVRVCEYFEIVTKPQNRLTIDGEGGEPVTLTEDDYWKLAKAIGYKPQVKSQYMADIRSVKWIKFCGDEILEETDFPSIYIPLVPVIGYETWIEGKRYLCGLTRRMMDGQRAYNVARTAEVELAMLSPKQPFMAAIEAIDPYKNEWANANAGNKAYLPYRAWTDDDKQLPMPQRQQPAPVSQGFLQMAQASLGDIEASVGMYRANLGQTSNETSGKAINARQRQGSIANYHYVDNQSRSIEHVYRIILSMIPHIFDVPRTVQIMREDGSTSAAKFDPKAASAVTKAARQIVYNPNVGTYAVRGKVGPGYATLRQESAEQLGQIMSNPALAQVVGPFWAQMQDWPGADKLAKAFLAVAPPPVQNAYSDDSVSIPPEVQAKLSQMQQQTQQMQQVIEQLHGALTQAQQQLQTEDQKLQLEQEKNQIAAQKNQIQLNKDQLQHQQALIKQGAENQRAMDKHQTAFGMETIKQASEDRRVSADADVRLQIVQMQTETQKQIADLTQMVQLMIAHIDPPQPLAEEVSEDLNDNETSES